MFTLFAQVAADCNDASAISTFFIVIAVCLNYLKKQTYMTYPWRWSIIHSWFNTRCTVFSSTKHRFENIEKKNVRNEFRIEFNRYAGHVPLENKDVAWNCLNFMRISLMTPFDFPNGTVCVMLIENNVFDCHSNQFIYKQSDFTYWKYLYRFSVVRVPSVMYAIWPDLWKIHQMSMRNFLLAHSSSIQCYCIFSSNIRFLTVILCVHCIPLGTSLCKYFVLDILLSI